MLTNSTIETYYQQLDVDDFTDCEFSRLLSDLRDGKLGEHTLLIRYNTKVDRNYQVVDQSVQLKKVADALLADDTDALTTALDGLEFDPESAENVVILTDDEDVIKSLATDSYDGEFFQRSDSDDVFDANLVPFNYAGELYWENWDR